MRVLWVRRVWVAIDATTFARPVPRKGLTGLAVD
jgi:hypothetical protein